MREENCFEAGELTDELARPTRHVICQVVEVPVDAAEDGRR